MKSSRDCRIKQTRNSPDIQIRAAEGEAQGFPFLISACLIVKNEEQNLPRCLKSIRNLADEIIVVDTGSSDRTVDIARQYGAEVHHHPWEKDFSKHRNQSLSYAKGSWILIVDADEELRAEDGPKIRRTLSEISPSVEAAAVDVTDIALDGHAQATVNTIRLFRNGRGIHYEGIVHNQLAGYSRVVSTDAVIYHYGCYLSPQKMREKNVRTRTLLFQQLREDPQNPYTLYNLTMNFSQAGDFQRTLEYGEKAIALFPKEQPLHPTYVSIYTPLITACLQMNHDRKAEQYCLQAIANHPEHLDAYWLLTGILYKEGRDAEVISFGREALDLYVRFREGSAASRLNLPFMYANAAGFVHLRVGLSCLKLGLWEEALSALDTAVALHPRKKDALAEIVRTAGKVNRFDIGRTYALQGKRDFPEEKLFTVALMEHDTPSETDRLKQNAVSGDFWTRLGTALLEAGKFRDAEAALEKALQVQPESAGAHLGLLKIRWLDRDPDGMASRLGVLLRQLGLPSAVQLLDLHDLAEIMMQVKAVLGNEGRADLSRIASELGEEIEAFAEALRDQNRVPAEGKA